MLEGQNPRGSSPSSRHSLPSLAGSRLIASPYLSSDEREAMEDVAQSSRSVKAGTDLLREGDRTDHFHIVREGWACRYKTTREGARQIVALLLPGDAANLDSFLLDRLDYGVRSLTAMTVFTIPRDRLLALAGTHAGVSKALAWLAMIENSILSQWALRLGRQSAKQRLAHLLCEISVRLGADIGDDDGNSSFELPLTQEQIGDALGLTSVHVNRTIKELRLEALIEPRPGSVTITDCNALCRIGDFDPAYLHRDDDPTGSPSGRVIGRVGASTSPALFL